jgi:hypothetical protein
MGDDMRVAILVHTVVLPSGGVTTTVLCSVLPQAAKVKVASKITIEARMEILRNLFGEETFASCDPFRRLLLDTIECAEAF